MECELWRCPPAALYSIDFFSFNIHSSRAHFTFFSVSTPIFIAMSIPFDSQLLHDLNIKSLHVPLWKIYSIGYIFYVVALAKPSFFYPSIAFSLFLASSVCRIISLAWKTSFRRAQFSQSGIALRRYPKTFKCAMCLSTSINTIHSDSPNPFR